MQVFRQQNPIDWLSVLILRVRMVRSKINVAVEHLFRK